MEVLQVPKQNGTIPGPQSSSLTVTRRIWALCLARYKNCSSDMVGAVQCWYREIEAGSKRGLTRRKTFSGSKRELMQAPLHSTSFNLSNTRHCRVPHRTSRSRHGIVQLSILGGSKVTTYFMRKLNFVWERGGVIPLSFSKRSVRISALWSSELRNVEGPATGKN
jgi:hypothetical protein